jgi:hypothetical protein
MQGGLIPAIMRAMTKAMGWIAQSLVDGKV